MTETAFQQPVAPQVGVTEDSSPTRVEILWRLYDQHQQMARHHDSQRAVICQYILILAAAAVGIAKIGEFSPIVNVVLALFVVGIGWTGAVLTHRLSAACASQRSCGYNYLTELASIVPSLTIDESDTARKYIGPQPWYVINLLVVLLGVAVFICVLIHI